jgi:hypothetical protein
MAPRQEINAQEAALCRGYLDLVAPEPARARPAAASPYLQGARRLSLFRNGQVDNDLAFIRRSGVKGAAARWRGGAGPGASLTRKGKP